MFKKGSASESTKVILKMSPKKENKKVREQENENRRWDEAYVVTKDI